jgi:hypothetical protein
MVERDVGVTTRAAWGFLTSSTGRSVARGHDGEWDQWAIRVGKEGGKERRGG